VIQVLSVDTANDVVHLSLTQHAGRGGLQGMGVGPGYGGDGGGWVWTPGRGLQRIPPYSPLHDALTSLGDLAALHDLAARAPREQAEMVRERAAATVAELQDVMTRVTAEPTPSPVQQGLAALDALEATRLQFEADAHRRGLGQDYVDAGRATVEQLTALLQTAAQEERQR
jgi:hypothetical protein